MGGGESEEVPIPSMFPRKMGKNRLWFGALLFSGPSG
jgi:hypothetical protein